MNIEIAEEEYNKVVNNNLSQIRSGENFELKDPDQLYSEIIEVVHPFLRGEENNELEINLSSDGVIGYKGIEKMLDEDGTFDRKNFEDLYIKIRKERFDFLVWPAYAMSINQMKYSVFRDRLDKTLHDIEAFYRIIEGKKFSASAIKDIEKECRLSRAYLNSYTLAWLCSFKDFNAFLERRSLANLYNAFEKNESWHQEYAVYFSLLLQEM